MVQDPLATGEFDPNADLRNKTLNGIILLRGVILTFRSIREVANGAFCDYVIS